MTITVEIKPEVRAELVRQAASQGRELEAHAARVLEDAVNPIPVRHPERRTGPALIDAFAEIGGLLTDEDMHRMFTRNPSGARPVDLS